MVHNAEMLSGLEAAVLNAVDREMLLGDLSALIAIPSLGGHETPAQEWMAARAEAARPCGGRLGD